MLGRGVCAYTLLTGSLGSTSLFLDLLFMLFCFSDMSKGDPVLRQPGESEELLARAQH